MLLQLLQLVITFNLAQTRELIQGHVVWRHADRNSGYSYPTDPYQDQWKDLQFTEHGMSQEYELGKYLRSKYKHLLSKNYTEGEVYLRSIDTDRSLIGAQCVATGLYSDEKAVKWVGGKTPWKPIPIHSRNRTGDWLYKIYQDPKSGCEPYDEVLERVMESSKWYKQYAKKYDKFFKHLTDDAGSEEPITIKNVSALYDNLQILKSMGKSLPDWAERDMEFLGFLSGMGLGLEFTDYEKVSSRLFSKMRSGVILEHILKNMQQKLKGDIEYSVIGYSVDDRILVALLTSMGAYDWKVPPYVSCVMIDLYREDDGEYTVELWYRSGGKDEPDGLSFYNCDKICEWKTFKTVAESVATDKTTPKLCGIKDVKDCCKYLIPGILVLMSTTLLFFPLYICLRYMNRRKNEPMKYNILDLDEIESMRQEKSL